MVRAEGDPKSEGFRQTAGLRSEDRASKRVPKAFGWNRPAFANALDRQPSEENGRRKFPALLFSCGPTDYSDGRSFNLSCHKVSFNLQSDKANFYV